MVIILHGPRGCGKTRNADSLAQYFRCRTVHDGELPSQAAMLQIGGDHLILCVTGEEQEVADHIVAAPGGVRIVAYDVAMRSARIAA